MSAISLRDVQNTLHTVLEVDAVVTALILIAIGLAGASVVRKSCRVRWV